MGRGSRGPSAFSTRRIRVVDGQLRRVDVPLLGTGADMPNSGLVPILRHWAASSGTDLVVTRDCNARLTLSPPAVDAAIQPMADRSLIAFLVHNETGLIEYGSGVEPAALIADIIRAPHRHDRRGAAEPKGGRADPSAALVALGNDPTERSLPATRGSATRCRRHLRGHGGGGSQV